MNWYRYLTKNTPKNVSKMCLENCNLGEKKKGFCLAEVSKPNDKYDDRKDAISGTLIKDTW